MYLYLWIIWCDLKQLSYFFFFFLNPANDRVIVSECIYILNSHNEVDSTGRVWSC